MERYFGRNDLTRLLDALPVAVACIARDRTYLFANDTYRAWFGSAPVHIAGKRMDEVLPPPLLAAALRHVPQVLTGDPVCFTARVATLVNPGAVLRVRYLPVAGEGGGVDRWFALIDDVGACFGEQERLRRLAETDALTGIHNRRSFIPLAEESLRQARQNGQPVALLMLDIDRFKQINDNHGHAFGDDVLKAVAAACVRSVREGDVVGRLGGEEFGVLLPAAGIGRAAEIAERLRQTVERLRLSAESIACPTITVSVGVAAASSESTIDDLLAAADRELYRAKRTGRNRTCVPMSLGKRAG